MGAEVTGTQIWLGLVELSPIDRSKGGAFTTFVCVVDSVESFKMEAVNYFRSMGWQVVMFEDIEPAVARMADYKLDPEVLNAIEHSRTTGRPSTIDTWDHYLK